MSKLIKWSGSKDSQSNEIINLFPEKIKNYYEPFVGGGSIFLSLLEKRKIDNYYISDYNEDLVNIYKMIMNDPKTLIETYINHYDNFNVIPIDFEQRKKYFNKIRKKYNDEHKPEDFFWIMRTTTNGMPRYNKSKMFNNSCHFTRGGMMPDKVEKLITKYNKLFNSNNITFYHSDYKDINYKEDSFIYFDPPYQNTKSIYFGNFNNEIFIKHINKLKQKWSLSYDGKVNDKKVEHETPLYKTHHYIVSGNSSFRRIIGNTKDSIVYESLYLNY